MKPGRITATAAAGLLTVLAGLIALAPSASAAPRSHHTSRHDRAHTSVD